MAASKASTYLEGDRSPTLDLEGVVVDKKTPFCCEDLHDPPCRAYHGKLPDAIKQRVVDEETMSQKAKERKRKKREAELEEQQSHKRVRR